MNLKILGAILIIAGCGGFGFSVAAAYKAEALSLRRLIRVLDLMECELQYRMTPLPELCRSAAVDSRGCIRNFFDYLARELEKYTAPDVASCTASVLNSVKNLPPYTRKALQELGGTMGRFDLSGQIRGLQTVRQSCVNHLSIMENNADVRLRSYQTLGLCAGAALAILFI